VETRSFVVGGSGFLWSRIEPDVDEFAVDADPCGPFRALPINAFEARTVAPAGIARILGMGRLAQIRDAIVRPIVISMIDLSGRVLAVDIKPREPMRVMRYPVDPDQDVPVRVLFTCLHSRGHASLRHAPIKKPRFRGVVE
jgi:hypothetical protein